MVHINGTPVGFIALFVPVLLAYTTHVGISWRFVRAVILLSSGASLIVSSILLMNDFLKRFATCTDPNDAATCAFNTYKEGAIVATLSVGTLIGALLGSTIADRLGRRRAMTLECLVFIIGVLIQVTAFTEWRQLVIGRGIAGLGVGGLSLAVPAYQAECAPRQIRGSLIAIYQLMITFGILVAAVINIGTRGLGNSGEWRIPIAIGIVWALFLGIGILFMPESPRWLLLHGKRDEALKSIARLRGKAHDHNDAYVQSDFREISEAVQVNTTDARWVDCFRRRNKTLYRTLLLMALQAFQQLTGANYFFYYGASIFQSVGLTDPFATQIILNAVNFVCTFLGIYVMEKFGRRVPLIVGGVWNCAFLIVFSAAGTAVDPLTSPGIGKTMLASGCLFILGYASTWAPGIWILVGETFNGRTRAKQGSLATASNWFLNWCIAFFTTPITASISYAYGFIFAGCNLLGAIVVFFFLYESSGLPLEAVDMMYNDSEVKPWTSSKWAPPGYSSRSDVSAAVAEEEKMDRQQTLVEHADGKKGQNGHLDQKEPNGHADPEATAAKQV